MQGNSFENRDWLEAFRRKQNQETGQSTMSEKSAVQLRWRLSDFLQAEQEIFSTSLTYHMVAKFVVSRLRNRNRFVLSSPRNRLCNVTPTSWNNQQFLTCFVGKTVSDGLSIGNVKKEKRAENCFRIWSVFNGKGKRKLTSFLVKFGMQRNTIVWH